jgi:phospho-N-acetylmuramoyl-pentapeptide-transferase
VIFIITAVSNGANITDGLDGLATGTSALISVALGIFAYASSSLLIADYLNIMFIPTSASWPSLSVP